MFAIELDNKQLRDALDELLGSVTDLSEPMADIARLLANATEDAFQDERSPFGKKWKRLRKATKELRRERGGGDILRILQDTGGLAGSVSYDSGDDWAEVGEAKVYAAIHQFGGKAGRGRKVTIPPRPSLPVDDDGNIAPAVVEDILDVLEDHLSP